MFIFCSNVAWSQILNPVVNKETALSNFRLFRDLVWNLHALGARNPRVSGRERTKDRDHPRFPALGP